MSKRFVWRVKTSSINVLVEADDTLESAARAAGVKLSDCLKWYPFALKRVLTDEEKEAQSRRFEYLKKLDAERKALRKEE